MSIRPSRHWSIVAALGFCVAVMSARWACAAETGGAAAVNNPVELQPLDQLSATLARPLFAPTRRPPPKPVAVVARPEPPPPPPPPPSVVLLGIVSEDGDGRAAIKQSGDKVMRVRAGDDVGGWKVDRIEPRRLVLTLGERSVDFALFAAATKGATAAKAAKSDAPPVVERRIRPVRASPPKD